MHEESIKLTFAAKNVRWTRQRSAVYAALVAAKTHPTAEELRELILGDEAPLSLATVYNTLETLSEAGLCRRLAAASGCAAARFDADLTPHAHVTMHDGTVSDVPPDASRQLVESLPPEALRRIERALGVRLTGVHIHLTAEPAPSAGARAEELKDR